MARPSSLSRMNRYAILVLAGACLFAPLGGQSQAERPESENRSEITEQSSPGQVSDSVCQSCHPDLYQAFQETGKARSFFRPSSERSIENFAKFPYYHEPSSQYYEMVWKESILWFRRYMKDASGGDVLVFEVEVNWILGSGSQVRNYLYQTPLGELFQLPLAWYAEPVGWAMAAGYDNSYHQGVLKSLRRECLFCHNAYPELEVGSDRHGAPNRFPRDLPQGIGCQRCHGPAASHVAAYQAGASAGQDPILKLSQLPPSRRLQPVPLSALPSDRRNPPIRPWGLLLPTRPGAFELPGGSRCGAGGENPVGTIRNQSSRPSPAAECLFPGVERRAGMRHVSRPSSQSKP